VLKHLTFLKTKVLLHTEVASLKHMLRAIKNPVSFEYGVFLELESLTMSYFHMRMHTIIGAKAFHCPVRDGKEWYHLAMVVRQRGLAVSAVLCTYLLANQRCG
jgi:hypothetical protein